MKKNQLTVDSLVLLQFRAWRLLRQQLSQEFKGQQLTVIEWLSLLMIEKSAQEELTISDLAELLSMPLSQVTVIAKTLEKSQFIKQKTDHDDRRRQRLYITGKGHGYLDYMRSHAKLSALPTLNEEELTSYVKVLNSLLEQLAE